MTKWQPIETAPINCRIILWLFLGKYDENESFSCEGYLDSDKEYFLFDSSEEVKIKGFKATRWMPLPEPRFSSVKIKNSEITDTDLKALANKVLQRNRSCNSYETEIVGMGECESNRTIELILDLKKRIANVYFSHCEELESDIVEIFETVKPEKIEEVIHKKIWHYQDECRSIIGECFDDLIKDVRGIENE